MKAIIGKKVGMSQIFDENGKVIPVTVIEAGPCVVVQKKTAEKEGYAAVQLGYEVATLLNNGLIYNDILERTGASSATISRVNRSLIYGAGGYESVLEKMREQEEKEAGKKEQAE